MYDGKTPNWYHFECFFKKQRPKSVDDIANFETIRVEDQEKIKGRVGVATVTIVPDKKGKKRAGDTNSKLKKEALKDFTIEYAKSGRAMCRGCEQKILKDEVNTPANRNLCQLNKICFVRFVYLRKILILK